jgi:hypothetical protein
MATGFSFLVALIITAANNLKLIYQMPFGILPAQLAA